MKNWKTGAAGLATAFFGFVLFSPEQFQHFPWLISLAKYAIAGGLASMGLMSKDFNSHSTVTEVNVASDKEAAKAKAASA